MVAILVFGTHTLDQRKQIHFKMNPTQVFFFFFFRSTETAIELRLNLIHGFPMHSDRNQAHVNVRKPTVALTQPREIIIPPSAHHFHYTISLCSLVNHVAKCYL